MKLYFSSKQIPQLQALPLLERLTILREAQKHLTGPEKVLLNVLKLLLLIPAFVMILQISENWWALAWALLIFLLYPIVVKPIQFSLSAKYISLVKPQGH
ncbi:DUF6170 family protein [Flavobacterium sp. W21_SRS_FM6]|uniref:DUF6170 family protein n=1 Tax=Flavobacterium sp. W21_SRS_FM6 TaxID=3240268 RepID=UPI003F923A25